MPNIMKISSQGQIRIPKKIMSALGIDKGDYVEVAMENRQIVLKPRKLIDPTQSWFWTKEWQEMEAVVDQEMAENQMSEKFETAEDAMKWLKA